MKLVSLKNVNDDGCCGCMPRDQYAWGLRLYINGEQAEAMGITKAMRAGTQVTISAKAIVVSATESIDSDKDGGNDVSFDVQITDMGVEVGSVLRNAADVLYGSET